MIVFFFFLGGASFEVLDEDFVCLFVCLFVFGDCGDLVGLMESTRSTPSPTDLSLCKRKASSASSASSSVKRPRECGSPPKTQDAGTDDEEEEAPAASAAPVVDANTASMLAAMAFVTRARSSFMIGDILNSRWDPSHLQQHQFHQPHQFNGPNGAAGPLLAAPQSARDDDDSDDEQVDVESNASYSSCKLTFGSALSSI